MCQDPKNIRDPGSPGSRIPKRYEIRNPGDPGSVILEGLGSYIFIFFSDLRDLGSCHGKIAMGSYGYWISARKYFAGSWGSWIQLGKVFVGSYTTIMSLHLEGQPVSIFHLLHRFASFICYISLHLSSVTSVYTVG